MCLCVCVIIVNAAHSETPSSETAIATHISPPPFSSSSSFSAECFEKLLLLLLLLRQTSNPNLYADDFIKALQQKHDASAYKEMVCFQAIDLGES